MATKILVEQCADSIDVENVVADTPIDVSAAIDTNNQTVDQVEDQTDDQIEQSVDSTNSENVATETMDNDTDNLIIEQPDDEIAKITDPQTKSHKKTKWTKKIKKFFMKLGSFFKTKKSVTTAQTQDETTSENHIQSSSTENLVADDQTSSED